MHYIGLNGSGNTLVVNNGGQMIDLTGIVGGYSGNNNVVITAPGSVWSNSGSAIIGQFGVGNSLVISNGGKVVNKVGHIGTSSTNNTVLVSGPGSVWSNTTLTVGYYDSCSNSLVISGGGRVFNASGFVGYNAKSVSNSVHVADGGVWENCALCVGYQGASSSVVVAGGSVLATNITVGFASSTCDNWVQLDDGSIIVTNATTDAVFEVRNGQLILNGGALQVDRFVMTNACAQFVRTGGTFIYGTAVLDPSRDDDGDGLPNGWEQTHGLDPLNASDANVDSDGDGFTNAQEFQAGTDPQDSASAFRIIGIAPEGDDLRVTWMMGSGKTNALQSSAGDSGLYTNSFGDIFTVTNTVGSATNYLDAGAATNGTARFYRVRLVP